MPANPLIREQVPLFSDILQSLNSVMKRQDLHAQLF